MEEIWRDIKDYEGLYQVSNLGNVRSLDRFETNGRTIILYKGKMLKPSKTNKGYQVVSLSKNNKPIKKYVHRLVAEAFLSNPDNLPQVNHKDEHPENCIVTNLEWCDGRYNINYGDRNKKAGEHISKSVIQFSKNNEILKIWRSIKAAQKELKISNISSCCTGKRKTAGGYIWKYEYEVI